MLILEQNHPSYVQLRATHARHFHLDALLPDMVFADEIFDGYCWLEFEQILGDPFFEALRARAELAGESEFYAVCDEPFPQENFGHSGVAIFTPSDSIDEYGRFLDTENVQRTISARHIGNRFWFHGPTLTWAVHADRSVELAVGAHKGSGRWPSVPNLRYLSWQGVLEIAGYPFRQQLPPDIAARYEANYRAGSIAPTL